MASAAFCAAEAGRVVVVVELVVVVDADFDGLLFTSSATDVMTMAATMTTMTPVRMFF